jgi:hypothetical protein
MTVTVDELVLETVPGGETQQRGGGSNGGDSGANSGGDQPKPEEMERMWKQQLERAERIWAH